MILNEMKLLNSSQLNGVALKENPSDVSLVSRSLSSCSTDDFLPTFESEDDDWRKFGWLLELNDIRLPCLDENEKILKVDDAIKRTQLDVELRQTKLPSESMEIKMEPYDECVDPSEFCINKHEAVSVYTESIHSIPDCINREQCTPRAAELPTPSLCGSDGFPPVEARYVEETCSACPEQNREISEESEKENEMEEQPVAKRTRNALAKNRSSKTEGVAESKVCFFLGSEDEKMETDSINATKSRARDRHDSRCDSVLDYGLPTMCSRTATPLSELSHNDNDDRSEPIAKRTRHALPSTCVDGGFMFPNSDWKPTIHDDRGSPRPTSRRRGSRRRKYTKRLYCLCQTPYDRKLFYVGCDGCNGWFHPPCIGISEMEALTAEQYFCPVCVRIKHEVGDV
uniref:PHD-type domain-containing protein n=1 Tax=Parascaris univalens TaxID=6257 RepID=A0A915ADQ4_PARUN